MNNIATTRINSFGPSPEDQEQILEITVSELDRVLKEAGDFLNQAVALVEAVEPAAIEVVDADKRQRHADKNDRMRPIAEDEKAQHRHEEDVKPGEEATIGGRGGGDRVLLDLLVGVATGNERHGDDRGHGQGGTQAG